MAYHCYHSDSPGSPHRPNGRRITLGSITLTVGGEGGALEDNPSGSAASGLGRPRGAPTRPHQHGSGVRLAACIQVACRLGT